MNQIQVGTIQTINVAKKTEEGYVLQQNGIEIPLHTDEATEELSENREIDVFLYHDKQMNILATMTLPTVVKGHYDWAEVVEIIPDLGLFVNIGTTKDMLVSIDDLPLFEAVWPKTGDKLYVTLGQDRKGRLLALPATEGIIEQEREWAPETLMNSTVKGHVYYTSREGTAFLTEDYYRGFIHYTERETEPRLGQFIEGRVIDVKEDGTINVSRRPLKQDSMGADADMILTALRENDGMIPFSDKSDPEDIRGTYNMSKAAFKRALGRLMKQGYIEQRDGQTFFKK